MTNLSTTGISSVFHFFLHDWYTKHFILVIKKFRTDEVKFAVVDGKQSSPNCLNEKYGDYLGELPNTQFVVFVA